MMKLYFTPDWPVRCEFNFILNCNDLVPAHKAAPADLPPPSVAVVRPFVRPSAPPSSSVVLCRSPVRLLVRPSVSIHRHLCIHTHTHTKSYRSASANTQFAHNVDSSSKESLGGHLGRYLGIFGVSLGVFGVFVGVRIITFVMSSSEPLTPIIILRRNEPTPLWKPTLQGCCFRKHTF